MFGIKLLHLNKVLKRKVLINKKSFKVVLKYINLIV